MLSSHDDGTEKSSSAMLAAHDVGTEEVELTSGPKRGSVAALAYASKVSTLRETWTRGDFTAQLRNRKGSWRRDAASLENLRKVSATRKVLEDHIFDELGLHWRRNMMHNAFGSWVEFCWGEVPRTMQDGSGYEQKQTKSEHLPRSHFVSPSVRTHTQGHSPRAAAAASAATTINTIPSPKIAQPPDVTLPAAARSPLVRNAADSPHSPPTSPQGGSIDQRMVAKALERERREKKSEEPLEYPKPMSRTSPAKKSEEPLEYPKPMSRTSPMSSSSRGLETPSRFHNVRDANGLNTCVIGVRTQGSFVDITSPLGGDAEPSFADITSALGGDAEPSELIPVPDLIPEDAMERVDDITPAPGDVHEPALPDVSFRCASTQFNEDAATAKGQHQSSESPGHYDLMPAFGHAEDAGPPESVRKYSEYSDIDAANDLVILKSRHFNDSPLHVQPPPPSAPPPSCPQRSEHPSRRHLASPPAPPTTLEMGIRWHAHDFVDNSPPLTMAPSTPTLSPEAPVIEALQRESLETRRRAGQMLSAAAEKMTDLQRTVAEKEFCIAQLKAKAELEHQARLEAEHAVEVLKTREQHLNRSALRGPQCWRSKDFEETGMDTTNTLPVQPPDTNVCAAPLHKFDLAVLDKNLSSDASSSERREKLLTKVEVMPRSDPPKAFQLQEESSVQSTECEAVLDLDFQEIIGQQDVFKKCLVSDLTRACGDALHRIEVTALRAGSVIADVVVERVSPNGCTPLESLRALQKQLGQPDSLLMQGKYSCKIVSLTVKGERPSDTKRDKSTSSTQISLGLTFYEDNELVYPRIFVAEAPSDSPNAKPGRIRPGDLLALVGGELQCFCLQVYSCKS